MSKPITFFEHEVRPFPFDAPDRIDAAVSAIARLNQLLGTEILRPTLRRGEKMLAAAEYVGVVRTAGMTVQILPKIYRRAAAGVPADAGDQADRAAQARQATRNLLAMMEIAGMLQVHEHRLAPLLQQQDTNWFEILTRLYASHLIDEWERGPARSYQPIDDDLPVLKGSWRIAQQLRRPDRKHLFAVTHDEFTADGRLNRVFRFIVERLMRLTRDSDNRDLLGQLRQWMDEVALLPAMTARDAPAQLINRTTRRFEPLLNLARLFLDGGALQLSGGATETFSFLLDMNQLFESFLAGFIRRYRKRILVAELNDCELLAQSLGARLFLATQQLRPAFMLKPDLALRSPGDGSFPLLIDAKYKRLDPAHRRVGVAESDFYQMNAYARRYSAPRVLLVYPQPHDLNQPLRREFMLHDRSATIVAATINVSVDLAGAAGRNELADELRTLVATEAAVVQD